MPTETILSSEQERALDLSRHVVITAAAGSGKTTLLVERFVRILEHNGFKPDQIVALTFTEEAAAQMRQRIRQAVEIRRDQFTPGDRTENPWERVYDLLSLAKITTIHGFCLSLLKEYPLEAGLDPAFQLLSPVEQQSGLFQSVCVSLTDLSKSLDSALEVLLEYVPRGVLEPLFLELIRRRNQLSAFDPNRFTFRYLEKTYRMETAQVLTSLPIWDQLQRLLSHLPQELLRASDSCSRRCQAQLNLFLRRRQLRSEEFITRFAETFSIRVNPSKQWQESAAYPTLKNVWNSLKRKLKKYPLSLGPPSSEEDHHFHKALKALHLVYSEILARFQQQKSRDSVVDFEDLLERAERLVRNPRVREALRYRYRFFLVDEFQDTNYLQWNILHPLIGPEGNFFAVGDAKQSIYRFRNVDVTVFGEVQRWIKRRGRVLEVGENYRSVPELIEFNNRVFGYLFRPGLNYEAVHQEMVARRCDSTIEDQGSTREETENPVELDPRAVQVFAYDPASSPAFFEPELVARCVKQLVRTSGFRHSEIGILLRSRTRLKDYEEALRQNGIPFQTLGGIGFYEQQEVLDLVNLLRFLARRWDDAALAGILRSPLFNLSDEDLFLLSLEKGDSFWEKLQSGSRRVSPKRHWRFAHNRLQAWLKESYQTTITTFLRRALNETGYLEIVAASRRGPQNCANIEKFLDLVRTFEKNQARTFAEFLRFLDTLLKAEPKEAEAAVLEDPHQGVRIYTIHGAKGLQFPVVILPDLGSPLLSRRKDPFHCETLRDGQSSQSFVALKIWNPDKSYDELQHPVYSMLRRLDEYRQIAEEKRLLYVAMTRACDHLILIGKKTDQPSYARWLFDSEALHDLRIKVSSGESLRAGCEPSASAVSKAGVDLEVSHPRFPAPEAVSEKRTWTPTEIAHFRHCSYQYYLSGIRALPEHLPFSREQIEQSQALLGSAIHRMLEDPVSRIEDLISRIETARDLTAVYPPSSIVGPEQQSALRENILRHLRRITAHPFYQRLLNASQLCSEKSFHIRKNELLITGTFDKLFRERDGRWIVVDFKTTEIASSQIPVKVRQFAYDLQVEIYLWAVSQILSTDRLEGFLFFTHTGDLLPVKFNSAVAGKCENLINRLPRRLCASNFPKTNDPEHCYSCGFYRQHICSGARSK